MTYVTERNMRRDCGAYAIQQDAIADGVLRLAMHNAQNHKYRLRITPYRTIDTRIA